MYFCYVDESGCLGRLPSATSEIQPVLVVTSLFVPASSVRKLTEDFLELKSKFYAGALPLSPYLDRMNVEIKGSELRRDVAVGSGRERRHAIGYLDQVFGMLRRNGVLHISRAWIKQPGGPFPGHIRYSLALQDTCAHFQHFLTCQDDVGLVIADNRRPAQNRNVAHSVFTQKFRTAGDAFDRIVEMPTFGDSQNHAALQLCDLVCSAVMFPVLVHTYCTGHVHSLHVRPGYSRLAKRYRENVKRMQYRYQDSSGRWRGGLYVTDEIARRRTALVFK